MPTVLLDACIPVWLQRSLPGAAVSTAKQARLDGLSDPLVLKAIAGRYDVLVTLDRVLPMHAGQLERPFAIVILKVGDQSPAAFQALAPKLALAINHVMPGDVVVLGG